jgi:hypothetical protein
LTASAPDPTLRAKICLNAELCEWIFAGVCIRTLLISLRFLEYDFVHKAPTAALHFQGLNQMKIADVLTARSSFIVLQVLDLTTTLIAFHYGAFEVNPLVGRLTNIFGPAGGVLFSKVIAVLIIFRVRKLMWVANLFYLCVVCWNTIVLLSLAHIMHR